MLILWLLLPRPVASHFPGGFTFTRACGHIRSCQFGHHSCFGRSRDELHDEAPFEERLPASRSDKLAEGLDDAHLCVSSDWLFKIRPAPVGEERPTAHAARWFQGVRDLAKLFWWNLHESNYTCFLAAHMCVQCGDWVRG